MKKLYDKRRALGLCIYCEQPKNPRSTAMCNDCLEDVRNRNYERRHTGKGRPRQRGAYFPRVMTAAELKTILTENTYETNKDR